MFFLLVLLPFPADEQDRTFKVAPGDSLRIECRAPYSVPKASFKWYRIGSHTDPNPRGVMQSHRIVIMEDGKITFISRKYLFECIESLQCYEFPRKCWLHYWLTLRTLVMPCKWALVQKQRRSPCQNESINSIQSWSATWPRIWLQLTSFARPRCETPHRLQCIWTLCRIYWFAYLYRNLRWN